MKIHFIGIGGIGISALAQYFFQKGETIQGSDLVESEVTKFLRYKGIKVFLNQKASHISKDIDEVIYSPAVRDTNPEIKKARKLGIRCYSYPEALGVLTKSYFTIAICGTHGKSTTTAMIGLILTKGGLDPTVILGTKLKEFLSPRDRKYFSEGTNFRMGHSKYLVIEADEYAASFLNYWPKIIVLTNIEEDHLDYYKNLSNLINSFARFVSHLPPDGVLVENGDNKNVKKILRKKGHFLTKNFQLLRPRYKSKTSKLLKIPGDYNVSNALAALEVAKLLKIPDRVSSTALSNYKGAWRRQECYSKIIGKRKFTLISDYAHHPTEIEVTLRGIRQKFPHKVIWLIFQPHQYQRTFYLFKDFVKVFSNLAKEDVVNKVIITDIYNVAGREKESIKRKVNSQKLVRSIGLENVVYLSKPKIISYVKKHFKGQILIIMGAGDIYKLEKKFKFQSSKSKQSSNSKVQINI